MDHKVSPGWTTWVNCRSSPEVGCSWVKGSARLGWRGLKAAPPKAIGLAAANQPAKPLKRAKAAARCQVLYKARHPNKYDGGKAKPAGHRDALRLFFLVEDYADGNVVYNRASAPPTPYFPFHLFQKLQVCFCFGNAIDDQFGSFGGVHVVGELADSPYEAHFVFVQQQFLPPGT